MKDSQPDKHHIDISFGVYGMREINSKNRVESVLDQQKALKGPFHFTCISRVGENILFC